MAPEPTPAPPAPQEPSDDVSALRAEAAGRRRQLRDTEAQRDALQARVDESDRVEVERLAGDRLTDPADFWHSVDLDDLRGEDGLVDLALAGQALAKVEQDHPHWTKPPADFHGGARESVGPPPPSFGELLKRARGG